MATNLFIGIFMPVLVFAILSYTLYHYVFTIQGFDNFSCHRDKRYFFVTVTKVCIAAVLSSLSFFSYCAIMLEKSRPIPLNNSEDSTEKEIADVFPEVFTVPEDESVVALSLSRERGHPLYCNRCKSNRPERAHHCKECNRCAYKMDHHCVWINGCVDRDNYKYFFLFVLYTALYSIFVAFTTIPLLFGNIKKQIGSFTMNFLWKVYQTYISSIYHFWRNITLIVWYRTITPLFSGVMDLGIKGISVHWYMTTMLGCMFGLVLALFASVHFWYIIWNQTSIEHISKKLAFVRVDFDKSGRNYEVILLDREKGLYDIGFYRNWCSVMGTNPFSWFVPFNKTKSSFYEYNSKLSRQIVHKAKIQRENRLKEGS